MQACTHVYPAAWNGTAPGTLYDCAGRHDATRSVKLSVATPPGSGTAVRGGIKLGPAAAVQRLVTCLKNHGWNPYTQPRPHVTHRTQSAQRLRLTHPRSSPREST